MTTKYKDGDMVECITNLPRDTHIGAGYEPNLVFKIEFIRVFNNEQCLFGGKGGNGVYAKHVRPYKPLVFIDKDYYS